jgi:uncharacterized protein YkwD
MTPSTRPHRLRRGLLALGLAFGLVVAGTACDPYSAPQERTRELINVSRDNHGRNRLPMSIHAARKAQAWAEELARCRCLKHSRLAAGMPAGWKGIAENVGYGTPGGNLMQVHRAFLNSSGHRANIMGRWNVVGTGHAMRNNVRYVVHVYARY